MADKKEPEHIKCPICGGKIKFNRPMTSKVKRGSGCFNEYYVHVGNTLYKQEFEGHNFPS